MKLSTIHKKRQAIYNSLVCPDTPLGQAGAARSVSGLLGRLRGCWFVDLCGIGISIAMLDQGEVGVGQPMSNMSVAHEYWTLAQGEAKAK